MEVILFCVILYYAVKTAHESAKAAFKSSRKAYAGRAAKAHPGMPRGQQVRSALKHDLGFAAAQLRHGFPSARHGFAQGWHEARTAHAQAHAGREKAKTEHAESLAGLIEEVRQYRERQAAAAGRARSAAGGTPEGSTSPGPEKVIPGTAEDVPPETDSRPHLCWSCFVRDGEEHAAWCATRKPVWPDDTDGPTYSWGLAGAAYHWPAANLEQAERQAQAASRDGRTHVVLEYPPGGGRGMTVAAFLNGAHSGRLPADDRSDDEWAASLPGEELREEDLSHDRIPDCWLCGLPVDGGELGASAHQRCAEVNDRDMERTEVADDRDTDEVERGMRSQGRCPWRTAYGHGGSPRYCGQPINGDDDGFCPQHQAEDENDYDRAADEVHRHTRELLAEEPELEGDERAAAEDHAVQYEPFFGDEAGDPWKDQPAPDASRPAGPTEGTTSMSDTTYGSVATDMTSEVATAENRAAEVNAARVAAEAQAQEAAEAKARALRISEDMQALDMDPATLGAIADHIDAADAADKAHQEAEEALGRAHAATVRVTETAQNVQATMAQGHAGLAAAHQEAPVVAADKGFYQD